METLAKQLPAPPWDMDSAAARLELLQNDFNAAAADKVVANFAKDAEVRFGLDFLTGQEQIMAYLIKEFNLKMNYTLKLELWGALKGRMAVRSELQWHDQQGAAFKNYGVQVLQFDDQGLIKMHYLSFNDQLLSNPKLATP